MNISFNIWKLLLVIIFIVYIINKDNIFKYIRIYDTFIWNENQKKIFFFIFYFFLLKLKQ